MQSHETHRVTKVTNPPIWSKQQAPPKCKHLHCAAAALSKGSWQTLVHCFMAKFQNPPKSVQTYSKSFQIQNTYELRMMMKMHEHEMDERFGIKSGGPKAFKHLAACKRCQTSSPRSPMRSRKGRHPQRLDRSTLTSSLNDMHLTFRKASWHDRVQRQKNTQDSCASSTKHAVLIWSLAFRDWVCFV